MGKAKNRWTFEEESALVAGVKKYGTGRWKDILSDHLFSSSLIHRSNVDLKDKWRNLTGNASRNVEPDPQRPRDKEIGPRRSVMIFGAQSSADNLKVIDVDVIDGDNENVNRYKINYAEQISFHANCNDGQRIHSFKTLEDLASDAANTIKEAERMASETAEVCRDVESLQKIAEESMVLQNLADELLKICT